MKNTQIIITHICDKCHKEGDNYMKLKTLYKRNPNLESLTEFVPITDLCEDCWVLLMVDLGKEHV